MHAKKESFPARYLRFAVLAFMLVFAWVARPQTPRSFEITADANGTFKVKGQKEAVISTRPGEVVRLRISAIKGSEWAKDGTIHSFTIRDLKDQGWDLPLKEGTHEYTLAAPSQSGEYTIECTVKCGTKHENMHMKLVVAA